MNMLPELGVQIACQSSPSLTRDFAWIPRTRSAPGMPCLGQCLHLGRGSRDERLTNIVALQGHTVRSRLAHSMQTVKSYVRTQSPSVKEGCAALDPSSPPAVTDQVARTSSDGSQDGKSGVSFSMSLIAAALKPRSILIATDFSEASRKSAALFPGTRSFL